MRKIVAIFFLLLVGLEPIHAKQFNQDFMAWTNFRWQYFSQSGFDMAVNSSFRFINQDPGFNQNVTSAGLGYSLNPNLALWAGYGFIPSQPVGSSQFSIEQRSWQMVDWAPINSEHFALDWRSTLEQRYLRDNPGTAWRLRQFIQIDWVPFINFVPIAFTPVISDEMFFDLNHPQWVSSSTFSQNRFFIGISVPLKKQVVVFQLGYMNQYIIADNANSMRHIFRIGLVFL